MALHTIVEHDSTHIKPYIDAKIGNFTGHITDNEPYVLRQGKGNLADMDLVGGSLAWDQQLSRLTSSDSANGDLTYNRCTDSYDSSTKVHTLTALENTGTSGFYFNKPNQHAPLVTGHKYLQSAKVKSPKVFNFKMGTNDATQTFSSIPANVYSTVSGVFLFGSSSSEFLFNFNVNNSWSGSESVYITDLMLIDLTQLFGSTIADYIYSLEQATAGAGVAWFRKYFPNAYYGYQSGKIESVNVASRKVVGKNLLNVQLPSETKNGVTLTNNGDGTYTLTGTSSTSQGSFESTQTIELEVGTYIWRASLDGSDIGSDSIGYAYVKGLNGTTNWYRSYGGERHYKLIVTEKSTIKLGFSWYNATSALNITFYPMIRLATVEDATYEPYQSSEYAFDPSIQLRGIPKLVDNKLSYDGDIYTADGTVTRKYRIVDLGTLSWIYQEEYTRFYTTSLQSVIKGTTNNVVGNILASKYVTVPANFAQAPNDCIVAESGNKNVFVRDTAYTDVAAFTTAMSGVYLVYELATPTTESATAFQNPQRAFTDGTEEFIDAGVTAGTRDVSIPVGNNTTYQLNETLPPIEDYVDGAVKFKAAISALGTDESGRTTASRAYTTGEFFYKDGKMYKVLTSIAQGATFTIDTNCQQTTLFAELKALAQ